MSTAFMILALLSLVAAAYFAIRFLLALVRKQECKPYAKKVAASLAVGVAAFVGFGLTNPPAQPDTATSKASTESAASDEVGKPDAPDGWEAFTERVAKKEMPSNFRRISVTPDLSTADGKIIVSIHYKTRASQKADYALIHSTFEKLFQSKMPVSEVVLYGELDDGTAVIKSMMTAKTASAINWERFDWRELPNVLDDKMVNPNMPKE